MNKKISEVKSQNSHLSTAMLAVMAAMNLADELLKSEASASKLLSLIHIYIGLIFRIDVVLFKQI